ncbi:MAG: hypothetical protein P8X57_12565, partial [Cyclobacteriaceae bacterium]
MKKLAQATMFCAMFFAIASCQPQQSETAEAPAPEPEPVDVTNGMILTGDLEGSEFSIATGDEMEKILEMQEAFNRLDA